MINKIKALSYYLEKNSFLEELNYLKKLAADLSFNKKTIGEIQRMLNRFYTPDDYDLAKINNFAEKCLELIKINLKNSSRGDQLNCLIWCVFEYVDSRLQISMDEKGEVASNVIIQNLVDNITTIHIYRKNILINEDTWQLKYAQDFMNRMSIDQFIERERGSGHTFKKLEISDYTEISQEMIVDLFVQNDNIVPFYERRRIESVKKDDVDVIYEDEEYLVQHLKTGEVCNILYFAKTSICITESDGAHFENYSNDENLYFFIIYNKQLSSGKKTEYTVKTRISVDGEAYPIKADPSGFGSGYLVTKNKDGSYSPIFDSSGSPRKASRQQRGYLLEERKTFLHPEGRIVIPFSDGEIYHKEIRDADDKNISIEEVKSHLGEKSDIIISSLIQKANSLPRLTKGYANNLSENLGKKFSIQENARLFDDSGDLTEVGSSTLNLLLFSNLNNFNQAQNYFVRKSLRNLINKNLIKENKDKFIKSLDPKFENEFEEPFAYDYLYYSFENNGNPEMNDDAKILLYIILEAQKESKPINLKITDPDITGSFMYEYHKYQEEIGERPSITISRSNLENKEVSIPFNKFMESIDRWVRRYYRTPEGPDSFSADMDIDEVVEEGLADDFVESTESNYYYINSAFSTPAFQVLFRQYIERLYAEFYDPTSPILNPKILVIEVLLYIIDMSDINNTFNSYNEMESSRVFLRSLR